MLHFIALVRYCFFFFIQMEGFWQHRIKKVYQYHFLNSICSLHVSMSHFGNSQILQIFKLL